jgi:ribose 5-phosphate isomerase A
MEQDQLKRGAALAAVDQVQSGMVVGLGFGSTAIHALRAIGDSIRDGTLKNVVGIPTAESIAVAARDAGIPLATLEQSPVIDITIDGADEVDPDINLIKGGGGALLREKIVAQASRRVVIVVDESKLSDCLGSNFKLPVEVIPFGWDTQKSFLERIGAEVFLRMNADGQPYTTDARNYILDCDFGPIDDLKALAAQIESRAGIVEHGLFLGLASEVIIGTQSGIRTLTRNEG